MLVHHSCTRDHDIWDQLRDLDCALPSSVAIIVVVACRQICIRGWTNGGREGQNIVEADAVHWCCERGQNRNTSSSQLPNVQRWVSVCDYACNLEWWFELELG